MRNSIWITIIFLLFVTTSNSTIINVPAVIDSIQGDIDLASNADTNLVQPGTAFFLELGGKEFLSINVDFRINKSNRFSFGIMAEGSPALMYYCLMGEKYSKFEIGGGVTVIGMHFHGVLGYRYQKKNGLLFRIGFTPIAVIPELPFIPWFGISIGYSR